MPSPALLSSRSPLHDGAPITIGGASFGGTAISVIAGARAVGRSLAWPADLALVDASAPTRRAVWRERSAVAR